MTEKYLCVCGSVCVHEENAVGGNNKVIVCIYEIPIEHAFQHYHLELVAESVIAWSVLTLAEGHPSLSPCRL